MKKSIRWFLSGIVAGGSLVTAVRADTTLYTFQNEGLDTYYSSWTSADATPGADGLAIAETSGATPGSGYVSLSSPFNATADGDLYVSLTFTINSPTGASLSLGPTVDLDDTFGDQSIYTFYNGEGGGAPAVYQSGVQYTLYQLISTPLGGHNADGKVNPTVINGINVAFDPESFGAYSIIFQGVGLSAVPEPTTLTLACLGAGALFAVRRRIKTRAKQD